MTGRRVGKPPRRVEGRGVETGSDPIRVSSSTLLRTSLGDGVLVTPVSEPTTEDLDGGTHAALGFRTHDDGRLLTHPPPPRSRPGKDRHYPSKPHP